MVARNGLCVRGFNLLVGGLWLSGTTRHALFCREKRRRFSTPVAHSTARLRGLERPEHQGTIRQEIACQRNRTDLQGEKVNGKHEKKIKLMWKFCGKFFGGFFFWKENYVLTRGYKSFFFFFLKGCQSGIEQVN